LVIVLGVQGVLPLAAPPTDAFFQASKWANVTGNLANMASECGNLTLLSQPPGSDTIIAGVARQGLWANRSASLWSRLGTGTGSAAITHRPSWITYDPAHPGVFWESGIYGEGGIYQTTNNGNTFRQLGSITHNDYVSVDFRDPGRRTLLASGHEQSNMVWRSADGGETWTNVGVNLPPNTNASMAPLVVSAQTYLVNSTAAGSGTPGIYRTTNGGASWQQVAPAGPHGPPLVASNGAIYWPAGDKLLRSTNSGATWSQVGSGLQTVPPIELPNGRLVSVGSTNLLVSADAGVTWSPVGPPLPYAPSGVIYSPRRQAFFIWRWDCGQTVPPDAIMKLEVLG